MTSVPVPASLSLSLSLSLSQPRFAWLGEVHNKDHQRMMVDPMLLIVQSLWSFLTAVTTTAVAPIAVIFTCIYLNLPEIT